MHAPKTKERLDPTLFIGLLLSGVCILGGLILERGEVQDVAQVTAALIVIGGTAGAVIVSTPKAVLKSVVRRWRSLLFVVEPDIAAQQDEIIRLAMVVRRSGILSLDQEITSFGDPFLMRAIRLVADGADEKEIRHLLELDLAVAEQHAESEAKLFETAGGYAPTIGIIGAVLGLIQVMKHLENTENVGRGIAVAFVATVYGVSLANLVLLPIGNKIRARAQAISYQREMLIEGAIAIQMGKNPRLIRQMLDVFAAKQLKGKSGKEKHLLTFPDAKKAS
jgi:chemotaxis protein MotA